MEALEIKTELARCGAVLTQREAKGLARLNDEVVVRNFSVIARRVKRLKAAYDKAADKKLFLLLTQNINMYLRAAFLRQLRLATNYNKK